MVAHWLFPGHCNEAIFNLFLTYFLFPALRQHQQRYIMYDNLAAHICLRTQHNVAAAGHVALHRPVHSPDFGPVELCFSNLVSFLRRHEDTLTVENLVAYVGLWTRVLSAQGAWRVRGYFAKSHYPVRGRRFTPYQ
eukprot:COSAG02_NODE_240_length_27672_cov_67.291445_3_plen_136_part_00